MRTWFTGVVVASVVGGSMVGATCVMAQGTGAQQGRSADGAWRGGPPMMMRRHGPRFGGRDQVALLLDQQLTLQLSAQQVNQLITIHEQGRQQAKPIFVKMQGLMPKDREGWKTMAPATPDSLGSLHEQLREMEWRQVSAASAVLTDDQRKIAARLAERPRFGGMERWARPGGQGGPHPGGRSGGQRDSSNGAHE